MAITRRRFLQDTAAASAALAAGARNAAGQQPGARQQVIVGGRRVKTIDVHAHCVVLEVMDIVRGKHPALERRIEFSMDIQRTGVGPERLKMMDADGIDVQALSINPYWYTAERDLSRQIIDLQNEKLAAICAAHPERFVAYATVALQFPELAAEQLEHAIKHLGLRGVSIGATVEGEDVARARFDPFWAKCEELQALVFMHPNQSPQATGAGRRLWGSGALGNVIGNPLDTTIALAHLIFEGTFDRFPNLKICAAHGGGYLPSYAARMDHGCSVFPQQCKGPVLKKKPSEYLRQIYVDSIVFTSEALRHLVAEVGAGQIVIGTDSPIPWVKKPVDHVLETPGLTDDERIAILGGTAAKLLKIQS